METILCGTGEDETEVLLEWVGMEVKLDSDGDGWGWIQNLQAQVGMSVISAPLQDSHSYSASTVMK